MARPTGSRTQEQHIAERDLLGTYLAEIGRVPLLTAEEEVELAKRIEAGLFAEQLLDSGGTEPRIGDAADEELEGEALLVPAMREGEVVLRESLEEIRERPATQIAALPGRLRRPVAGEAAEPHPVSYSERLRAAAERR